MVDLTLETKSSRGIKLHLDTVQTFGDDIKTEGDPSAPAHNQNGEKIECRDGIELRNAKLQAQRNGKEVRFALLGLQTFL